MSLIDHPGALHRAATWLPRGIAIDVGVCAFIVALGALQFALPLRAADFFNADTIYVELARSILDKGQYGVDYNDVQYPPGLPALLALSCVTAGCTHGVLIRSMAIYFTFWMLATYWLLKRAETTAVAATTCLLIAS